MNKREFEILRYIAETRGTLTQRIISEETGHSLGAVNAILTDLMTERLITDSYQITLEGRNALSPYKVDNAIIMAAGMSTRFVPFSYEKPKGLTVVKGEVLIERQIRQIKEVGIDEIVLVLGHMLEQFLYLKDKYGVKIVVNNDYQIKNNYSSLFFARDYLKRSYICSSDNYYPKNMFNQYEYQAVYCGKYAEGFQRSERGLVFNKNDLIIDTNKPANNQFIMIGYAYFDKEFSDKFKKLVEEYYYRPGSENLYWENIYAENVKKLKLYIRKCSDTDILEFDSVAELQAFDPNYIVDNALDSINNICSVKEIQCTPKDIINIKPIKNGFTNRSFVFQSKDWAYVYRNPGSNSNAFIDRFSEKKALEIAKELDVDSTYIYENEDEGWKVSHYMTAVEKFDFSNPDHLKSLSEVLHKLHDSHRIIGKEFNWFREAEKLLEKIKVKDQGSFEAMKPLYERITNVNKKVLSDAWPVSLCHNDIYEDNIIVSSDRIDLIDWEYAGDSDIGYDVCKLFAAADAEISSISDYLTYYYDEQVTQNDMHHLVGCAAIAYFYWFVWAKYLIANGESIAVQMMSYYEKTIKYLDAYEKM